jgi:hypothetical protein
MNQMPSDLHALLSDLAPLNGSFSPILRLGENAAYDLNLTNLSDACVLRLLSDVLVKEPGGDTKLATAYLIGAIAWCICEPLAGLALRGRWLTAARPDGIHLSQRFVHWEKDDKKGVSLAFDVTIDVMNVTLADLPSASGLAMLLQQLLEPLIDTLFRLSGLSRSALWRLVSDSLASTFLQHGRTIGQPETAIALARSILRDPASKLFNKQTDFEWVSIPSAAQNGDWMRVRGGCCRYYTAPDEDATHCMTCVLRSPESRRDRFRDYLHRMQIQLENEPS